MSRRRIREGGGVRRRVVGARRGPPRRRTRQLEERLKAGLAWDNSDDLVFTTFAKRGRDRKIDAPLHPRNVLWTRHHPLEAAHLPRARFHDLRHPAASLLIARGVQFAEVSMLLGHSELRITSDLYAHLPTQAAAKAARHMDALSGRQGVKRASGPRPSTETCGFIDVLPETGVTLHSGHIGDTLALRGRPPCVAADRQKLLKLGNC